MKAKKYHFRLGKRKNHTKKMATLSNIKELCLKILTLAEHPNTPPHEAAAAWRKLHALLLKHRLTLADIKQAKTNESIIELTLHSGAGIPYTYSNLACILGDIFQCELFSVTRLFPKRRRNLIVIGHKTNARLLEFFYHRLLTISRTSFMEWLSRQPLHRKIARLIN